MVGILDFGVDAEKGQGGGYPTQLVLTDLRQGVYIVRIAATPVLLTTASPGFWMAHRSMLLPAEGGIKCSSRRGGVEKRSEMEERVEITLGKA